MTPSIHHQAEIIPLMYTREGKKQAASALLKMIVSALKEARSGKK